MSQNSVAEHQPIPYRLSTEKKAVSAQLLDFLHTVLPPIAGLAILVLLWAAFSADGYIPAYFLPGPAVIYKEAFIRFDTILFHSQFTLWEAFLGFVFGNGAAVFTAFVFAYSSVLRTALFPIAIISRAIPLIAVTPLLVIAFGFGMPAIVILTSLAIYFPTLLIMVRGMRSSEVEYRELLHTLSASMIQRLFIIELPASLPFLFTSLKLSVSTALLVAMTGEWIAARQGLGYLIMVSSYHYQLPMMWLAVGVSCALTLTFLGLITLAESYAMRWRPKAPSSTGPRV